MLYYGYCGIQNIYAKLEKMLRGFALHYNTQFYRRLSVTNSEKLLIN